MATAIYQSDMSLPEAEKALADITKAFEARFAEVVEFDPKQENPSRTPRHNLPYIAYHTGLAKAEGELSPGGDTDSIADAVADFRRRMMALSIVPAKTLFWRVKPEISESGKGKNYRCRVYCRMMWV